MKHFISPFILSLIATSMAWAQEPTPHADKKETLEKVQSSGAVKIEKKPAVSKEALKQADQEATQKKEEATSSDKEIEEPLAPPRASSDSTFAHLFGLHAALGIPHPISYGLNYVHSSHLFSVEVSGGSYSGTFSNIKVGIKNTELALRWHPFAGSFYLGAIYGNQQITADKTEVITVANVPNTVNAKVEVKSNYISPHFGWMWGGVDRGFFTSMEFGYQSPSGVKTDFTTDANAQAQAQPEYTNLANDVRKQGDDIGNMGLPHVVLLKIGWLF